MPVLGIRAVYPLVEIVNHPDRDVVAKGVISISRENAEALKRLCVPYEPQDSDKVMIAGRFAPRDLDNPRNSLVQLGLIESACWEVDAGKIDLIEHRAEHSQRRQISRDGSGIVDRFQLQSFI